MTENAKQSDLRQRWARLWEQVGVPSDRGADIQPLLGAYESADRHYHNLRHLQHCLRELDLARKEAKDPAAIELAIWYHDAIYDPTRHDNEQRSADMLID